MFDFHRLVPLLERLSAAAARAKAEMAPQRRGRPGSADRDTAVSELLQMFELPSMEAYGLAVELSESGSRSPQRRRVQGRGGQLLLALFKHFDPRFNEPAIWGSIKRVVGSTAATRDQEANDDEARLGERQDKLAKHKPVANSD